MPGLSVYSLAYLLSLKSAGAGGVGHVCGGASVSLLTACPATVSQRRVALKVAGLAVCAAAGRRHKLTDEQVPLYISALIKALTLEQGTIGLFRSVPEQVEQVEQIWAQYNRYHWVAIRDMVSIN